MLAPGLCVPDWQLNSKWRFPIGWRSTAYCLLPAAQTSYICASTMPRAQNRAEKGSILLWRRLTFPIFLLFIYGLRIWISFPLISPLRTHNTKTIFFISVSDPFSLNPDPAKNLNPGKFFSPTKKFALNWREKKCSPQNHKKK